VETSPSVRARIAAAARVGTTMATASLRFGVLGSVCWVRPRFWVLGSGFWVGSGFWIGEP